MSVMNEGSTTAVAAAAVVRCGNGDPFTGRGRAHAPPARPTDRHVVQSVTSSRGWRVCARVRVRVCVLMLRPEDRHGPLLARPRR